MPKRIQRRRTRGWRMPDGAVYVGRGSGFGNPYSVGKTQIRMPAIDGSEWEHEGRLYKGTGTKVAFHHSDGSVTWHQIELATREQVVEIYRKRLASPYLRGHVNEIQDQLAGKDLACWCPLDQPCHADVLLEIANGDPQ